MSWRRWLLPLAGAAHRSERALPLLVSVDDVLDGQLATTAIGGLGTRRLGLGRTGRTALALDAATHRLEGGSGIGSRRLATVATRLVLGGRPLSARFVIALAHGFLGSQRGRPFLGFAARGLLGFAAGGLFGLPAGGFLGLALRLELALLVGSALLARFGFLLLAGFALGSLGAGTGNRTLAGEQFLFGQAELARLGRERAFTALAAGCLATALCGLLARLGHALALLLHHHGLGAAARKALLHGAGTGSFQRQRPAAGLVVVCVAHASLPNRLSFHASLRQPTSGTAHCSNPDTRGLKAR